MKHLQLEDLPEADITVAPEQWHRLVDISRRTPNPELLKLLLDIAVENIK